MYGQYNVGGRIETEYLARGGPAVLGNPTQGEWDAAREGKFQVFQNNASIYWHGLVNNGYATTVGGAIRDKWATYGWENGPLMYPKTSELNLTKYNGRLNNFEGGAIYWSANTGAHVVWGDLGSQWAAQGYENGGLGYPITDEYPERGGWEQRFEGGVLRSGVGPVVEPSATDPISKDDPRNIYNGLIGNNLNDNDGCSAVVNGRQTCVAIGRNAVPPVDPGPDPTITRRGGEETVEPSESVGPTTTTRSSTSSTTTALPAPTTTAESSTPAGATSSDPSSQTTTTESSVPSTSSESPAQTTTTESPAPTTTTTDSSGPSTSSESPMPPEPTEPVENPYTDLPQGLPVDSDEPAYAEDPAVSGETADALPQARADLPTPDIFQRSYCATKGSFRWVGKSDYACAKSVWVVRLYDNGKISGSVYGDVKYSLQSSTSYLNQNKLKVEYTETGSWGTGISPSGTKIILTTTHASSASNPQFVSSNSAYLPAAKFEVLQEFGTIPSNNSRTDTVAVAPEFQISLYPPAPTAVQAQPYPAVACDNMAEFLPSHPGSVGGCTIPKFPPVQDLRATSIAGIDKVADHIQHAQNNLIPGAAWQGRPLHRIANTDPRYSKNRSTACSYKFYTRPTGTNCDEYPMAITAEGANQYPNLGRTFYFCQIPNPPLPLAGTPNPLGWSACQVPVGNNFSQGGLTNPFFRNYRVQLNGSFYVNAN